MKLTLLFLLITFPLFAQNDYDFGSFDYGSYNYGDKSLGLKSLIVPGGAKAACYAKFGIIGTDTCWLDISGHGRHAKLHYAKRFINTAEWTANVLPYASEVLVEFPVSLLSFDLDSFMFDGNGTARLNPPISMFQDIDYGHKLYCKEIAQVLNSDSTEVHCVGVRYFTVYESAQTGTNLITAENWFGVPAESATALWVSKTGNDGTGDGTKAKPYLTIEACYKAKAAGSTIYVKSGTYLEQYSGGIQYMYLDKASMTIQGLGRVEIKTVSTSYVTQTVTGAQTFKRLILNGEGNTQYCASSYSANSSTTTISHCWLKSPTTNGAYVANNAAVQHYYIDNSHVEKGVNNEDGCELSYSYLSESTAPNLNNNSKCYYNKFVNFSIYYQGDINIKFNTFYNKKNAIVNAGTPSGSLNISHNKFICDFSTISGQTYLISIAGTSIPTITYNSFTLGSATLPQFATFIIINSALTPIINYNSFTSLTQSALSTVTLSPTTAMHKVTFDYNYVKNNSTSGITISVGGETTNESKFDSSELIGNYIIGSYLDYPLVSSTTHGFLLNAGINMTFKNNFISYMALGVAIKTGKGTSYITNGIWANKFVNNGRDIYARKIKGLLIANNTFYKDARTGDNIYIDTYDTYGSEDVLIKNCIFHVVGGDYKIGMDQHAADNGCKIYNSVLNGTGNQLSIASTPYTMAQAIAGGYFDSTIQQETVFNPGLWPVTPITSGLQLLSPYDYILDISTNWGTSIQLPVIVTKQNTTQIGAYIQ